MRTEKQREVAAYVARRLREERGKRTDEFGRSWSQEKLARAAELSVMTVRRAEKAATIPDWATLEALCDALGISLFELFPTTLEQADSSPYTYMRHILRLHGSLAPSPRGSRSETDQLANAS